MSKEDVVLVEETPTVQKIQAIRDMMANTTIAFETVVPQVILTLLFGGATVILAVRAMPIPDWLIGIDGLIVGFYFGSDYQYRTIKGKVTKNG